MARLDFNSLASKIRSTDPYRGTMRYPMENRSNRQNIFELVETDNDIEFHVSHGYRYEQKPISEARFKLLDGVRGARVYKKTHDHEKYEYYTHETTPRVLCVVRSDNTLEYVADSYYQGDNMKMTDWMGGYQYDSYRMSGTAYAYSYNTKGSNINHPVFKGLRINQETHEPVGMNVQVFRRTVDRKKSKELMAKYKEAFKSPDAMLKCMDTDTMVVTIKDILDEHFGGDGNIYISTSKCFEIAERMFAEGSNYDGVILHGFAQGIQGFNRWAIESFTSGQNRSYYRMIEPKNVVPRLLTCMAKKLYKEYKPFNEEEVDFKQVRSSEWGIRIVVDGVEIES
jgi:hypothetical protein